MAYLYKLDNNWVSSALMPLETIFTETNIKASTNAVNIFADNDIALGINIGSSRIAYKHNDILFKTAKVANGSSNMTYVTRPSIERGFVQWSGSFNRDAILQDLLAFTIATLDGNLEVDINLTSKTIVATGDFDFSLSWDNTSLIYNGTAVTGDLNITGTDLDITINTDDLYARLNGDFSSMNIVDYDTPATPFDLSYSVIDGPAGVFTEKEITLDYSSLILDDFGHQYFPVDNYGFGVSQAAIWFPSESPEYLKNDQFSFVRIGVGDDAGHFAEFNKDRLKSAVNTSTHYIDGLIECSTKTYIGYARVYSSYVYVDYYYIKTPVGDDECALMSATVSYGRACRVKISNTEITIKNIDSSLDYVALVANANSMAHDAYDKFRFGVGSFKSNYKLYSYRDKRDTLEIVFNRESSSKYVKVVIEDQPTRYKATITVKSGTKTVTSTKTFPRYSSNPLWSLGNTAVLNIVLKKSFDNVSDTAETLFTNGAITLEPDTIKILTRTLYVNVLDNTYAFPQLNLTYDTLAVVASPDADGDLANLQINYQPATGAIYGRIAQGSSYDYFEKDALLPMLNAINADYTFAMTCNISSLNYKDLDGNSHVYPFTNSTMIIAEAVNGVSGQFYRVYYKNADSYGFILAKEYVIEE